MSAPIFDHVRVVLKQRLELVCKVTGTASGHTDVGIASEGYHRSGGTFGSQNRCSDRCYIHFAQGTLFLPLWQGHRI
jgi:hypothetical protein